MTSYPYYDSDRLVQEVCMALQDRALSPSDIKEYIGCVDIWAHLGPMLDQIEFLVKARGEE